MTMREPSWWYGSSSGLGQAQALAPFGWAYGQIARRRMQSLPRYRSAIPVVCVGNFTAGGTGKTPFVAVICDVLRLQGHTPVVLSRGYGGTLPGPHWVDAHSDTATRVGDEPLLLARYAPVVISRDRVQGARAIAAAHASLPRATVIVMDDGIQNPALAKNLTIAVVDASRGTGNGRCIPAGPLRAPLAAQLPLVDAILLNQGSDAAAAPAASTLALVAAVSCPVLSALVAPAAGLEWLQAASVVAYAGIGVPQRFFATAAACGARLREQVSFPDHHAFTDADAQRLLALAHSTGSLLLTTEKDLVRIDAGQSRALAALRAATRPLPITLRLDPASLLALEALLRARVPVGTTPASRT